MTDFSAMVAQFARFIVACGALSIVLAGLLTIIMNPIAGPTNKALSKSAGPPAAKKSIKSLPPFSAELEPASKPSRKPSTVPSSGNTYARGHCTWYAKNKRPDLPNNLGNANTWFARAKAQGLPVGSAPKDSAIGQKGRHVVFVEGVNPDGTMRISEMNYRGLGVISHRTVPASSYKFIY